jgi:serine/threonine protein kinase
VMSYIEEGDLRQLLKKKTNGNYNKSDLRNKLSKLCSIAKGLESIHSQKLIHRDLHTGNILNKNNKTCYITDLGLCKPVSETDEKKIYGVLPYVAPEVLRGQPYTPAGDIYSFGVVAYELFANAYPYVDSNLDDLHLALAVCEGLRPKLEELKIPQLLENLIKQC